MPSNSNFNNPPLSPRPASTVAPPDHRADTVPPTSLAGGHAPTANGTASTSSVLAPNSGQMNPSATYTADEKVFHQTFPFVPLSEKVVESYQCSVSRSKVLRIGRLYLTALRMCFVSSFLKEPIHLPWDCVSGIEKKSNFLFETVLVKRTAAAIQQQAEHDLEVANDQKIQKESHRNSKIDFESQSRFRSSSTFNAGSLGGTTNGGVDVSELSTGGVGEDESFTGFLTGSSDGAFRMMLMLHSVRARYRRSAGLEQPSPQNTSGNNFNIGSNGGSSNDSSPQDFKGPTPAQQPLGTQEDNGGALPVASRSSTLSSQQNGYSAASNATTPSQGWHNTETPREMDNEAEDLLLSTNGSVVDPLAAASASSTSPARGASPAQKPAAVVAPLSPASTKGVFSPTSPNNNAGGANANGVPTVTLSPATTPSLTPMDSTNQNNNITPDIIATANQSKDMAVAARAAVVTTNTNEQIVLQSNLQRAMLTDEQRRKLERGHTHQRTSSMGLGAEGMGGVEGGDFSQHESILKAFPLVPKTEIIVDQFQCSYAINVHRIGRLYITSNYLLFSSHFMSEPITIRLVDIERVEKFQTIMVLDGFNVHLRPEASKLTIGQIAQAGGVVPACAIRAGMMTTNPEQGMTGVPVEGSAALLPPSSASREVSVGDSKGSAQPQSNSTTPRTDGPTIVTNFASPLEVNSGRASPSSQQSRQSAMSTPTLSMSNANLTSAGPPPFLAAGLPPSSALCASTATAYSKAVYTFTSFVGSRDQAYGILTHFCQTHSDRVAAISPLCPKPKDDIVAIASPTDDGKGKTDVAKGESPSTSPALLPATGGAPPAIPAASDKINSNGRTWSSFRTKTSKPHFYNSYIAATSQNDICKITTDFTGGLSDLPHFFGKEGAKELLPPLKFPVGADLFDIFYHCFDDDHEILGRYHEDRRDTGQSWEPWRPHLTATTTMGGKSDNGTGAVNGLGGGQREMKSKTVIRVVGEKICDYNEFQRYAFFNIAGRRVLMVQVSGQAQGAMFSDSFRAETMMIFEEDYVDGSPVGLESPPDVAAATSSPDTYFNPNRGNVVVTMKCYGYINFLRSVWVKGKILSAALTEMPECYKTLSAMMVKRVAEVMAEQRRAVSASAAITDTSSALAQAPLSATTADPAVGSSGAEEGNAHVAASSSTNGYQAGAGGARGTSFRDSLSPHNLFSFIATPSEGGGKPKVPIFVIAPIAISLLLVALYCVVCLLGALLWDPSGLPTVEAERARWTIEKQRSIEGIDVGLKSSTSYSSVTDDQLTAMAISDIYRLALRPLLVPFYGLFSIFFISLAIEYALATKEGLGM